MFLFLSLALGYISSHKVWPCHSKYMDRTWYNMTWKGAIEAQWYNIITTKTIKRTLHVLQTPVCLYIAPNQLKAVICNSPDLLTIDSWKPAKYCSESANSWEQPNGLDFLTLASRILNNRIFFFRIVCFLYLFSYFDKCRIWTPHPEY